MSTGEQLLKDESYGETALPQHGVYTEGVQLLVWWNCGIVRGMR